MHEITARVSYNRYNCKPNDNDCRKITYQLKRNESTLTPRQLAEYLCCGYSVSPTYPGKAIAENNPMWFVCIDLDHMKVDMEERLEGLMDTPTIAYRTFSNAPDDLRYRFIYVFTQPLYGKDFYTLQRELMMRNHFGDIDKKSKNINHFFHGTKHPVIFSGICYSKDIVPVQVDENTIITRELALSSILDTFICNYTETDIAELTAVGVTSETAEYYYTHSWYDFTHDYALTTTISEHTLYEQVDGECYAVAPDEFHSLPRRWQYYQEYINGKKRTVSEIRKWEDGENRGGKLYQAIITYRILNPSATPDDLLYCTVHEFQTFYTNRNSDGETYKFDNRRLAKHFISGMSADITIPRKPLKHAMVRITSNKVNKHAEAPRASAKERHKKILALYNPSIDMKSNLQHIRDTLEIRLTKRTLKKILRENSEPTTSERMTTEEKETIFRTLYDSERTDADNLQTIRDNIDISRATYYRWKRRWCSPVA